MRALLFSTCILVACTGVVDESGEGTADGLVLASVIGASPRIATNTTTIGWSSKQTDATVALSTDNGPDHFFASGSSGTRTVTRAFTAGHQYLYKLKASDGSVLASVDVLGAASAGGTIVANPPIVQNGGTSTIDWGLAGMGVAQVWVSTDGGPEQLFSSNGVGPAVATINVGHAYTFRLYAGSAHTGPAVATVVVLGIGRPGTGAIAAPQTVVMAHQQLTTAAIQWASGSQVAQVYVSHNHGPEALFATGASGTQNAMGIALGDVLDFRLYDGVAHTTLLGSARVITTAPYLLGPNYLATGTDVNASGFLRRYADPNVRATVRAQLQQMADTGATVIQTVPFFGLEDQADIPPEGTMLLHWPPETWEMDNLHQYAQDVVATQGRDGHNLKLWLGTGYLWAAEYTTGIPSGGLGHYKMTGAAFIAAAKQTTNAVIDAVAGYADLMYLDGEVTIDPTQPLDGYDPGDNIYALGKHNQAWYFHNVYPAFAAYASAHGVTPSFYTVAQGSNTEVLDNTFTDATYPVLNKHRAAYWTYRTLLWAKQQGMMPPRVDISVYPGENPPWPAPPIPDPSLYARILDDLDATLGGLGFRGPYAIAETWYPSNQATRQAVGAALAAQANRLTSVRYWPTPNPIGNAAPPFVNASYLAP